VFSTNALRPILCASFSSWSNGVSCDVSLGAGIATDARGDGWGMSRGAARETTGVGATEAAGGPVRYNANAASNASSMDTFFPLPGRRNPAGGVVVGDSSKSKESSFSTAMASW